MTATQRRNRTRAVATRLTATLAGAIGVVSVLSPTDAGAETRKTDESLAGERGKCVLRGYPTVEAHVPIWSAPEGGDVVAWFAGNRTALAVFDINPRGRSRVNTGTGDGSFRIAGHAETSRLPFFAERRIDIVPRHVWVRENQPLRVAAVDSETGGFEVELHATAPLDQVFTTHASCDDLAVDAPPPKIDFPIIEGADGYLSRESSVTVFDGFGADRKPVVELRGAGQDIFFWGTDTREGLVRVRHFSDVEVEGWVETSALTKLPQGEIADQPGLMDEKGPTPRYLHPAGAPREVVTDAEIPIRIGPREDATVIGRIEKRTRTLVMDEVAGWAQVLPASMHVVGTPSSGFWVPAPSLR